MATVLAYIAVGLEVFIAVVVVVIWFQAGAVFSLLRDRLLDIYKAIERMEGANQSRQELTSERLTVLDESVKALKFQPRDAKGHFARRNWTEMAQALESGEMKPLDPTDR